jgi:predicted RNA methylase
LDFWSAEESVFMRQHSKALLAVLLLAGSADARYCWNPNCGMCNRLFGPIGGGGAGLVAATTRVNSLTASPVPAINSTPEDVVQRMLDQLDLGPDDILYDLGCGDGRILVAAVRRFGCRAVGIERDPCVAEFARTQCKRAGCGRIRIVKGDARNFLLDDADAVTMYLYPPVMAQLVHKIDCPIVSYSHRIPGRANRIAWKAQGRAVFVAASRPGNFRVI